MPKDFSPSDVTKLVKDQGIKLVDFKFCDLLGTWQHFTTTLNEYDDAIFEDGLGFDGSLDPRLEGDQRLRYARLFRTRRRHGWTCSTRSRHSR